MERHIWMDSKTFIFTHSFKQGYYNQKLHGFANKRDAVVLKKSEIKRLWSIVAAAIKR